MKIGFLDLETQRWSDNVRGGFSNIQDFGLSVAVVNDAVYYEKDVDTLLLDLQEFDLVIGFNIINFDYVVLEGYRRAFSYASLPTFDILSDLHLQLGHRVSLETLCNVTLQEKKSGSGRLAVDWYQSGELNKVVEYCKRDVSLTKRLFEYGIEHSALRYYSYISGEATVCLEDWPARVLKQTNLTIPDAFRSLEGLRLGLAALKI